MRFSLFSAEDAKPQSKGEKEKGGGRDSERLELKIGGVLLAYAQLRLRFSGEENEALSMTRCSPYIFFSTQRGQRAIIQATPLSAPCCVESEVESPTTQNEQTLFVNPPTQVEGFERPRVKRASIRVLCAIIDEEVEYTHPVIPGPCVRGPTGVQCGCACAVGSP